MKSHNIKGAIVGIALGMALFAASLMLAARHLAPMVFFAILFLIGFGIYLWGCAALARAKGYTLGQGIFLGIAFPPALLLFILFDRTKLSKKELEAEDRENAEAEKSRKAALRRPLKGAKRALAWFFGLLFFGVGLATVAGYEIYWARVVVPERQGMATAISVSTAGLDPQNDGKLIHASGNLAGVETLADPEFGVAVDALRLRRRVWMYQWEQGGLQSQSAYGTEDAKGNTTTYLKTKTYNYSKDWSEKLIDSRAFYNAGHDNPFAKEVPDRTVDSAKVTLGAFTVSPELVSQIDNFQTVDLNGTNLATFAKSIHLKATLLGNEIYVGVNANQPAIGDLKIRFEWAPPTNVSVIARQDGNSLSPCVVGKTGSIAELRVGTFSAEEMTSQFAKSQFESRMLVWIFGGFAILVGTVTIGIARR